MEDLKVKGIVFLLKITLSSNGNKKYNRFI